MKKLDIWKPSKPLLWGLEEEWDEEVILKKAVHLGNLKPLPESPSGGGGPGGGGLAGGGLQRYEPMQMNKGGKTKASRKMSMAVV